MIFQDKFEYSISRMGKPTGFWLSDESGNGNHSWKEWCIAENFRDNFENRYDFKIDLNKILWIKDEKELRVFSEKYYNENPNTSSFDAIDWKLIIRQYSGILISPYQWDCRLDLLWYYCWDCASACIWDLTCLEEIKK